MVLFVFWIRERNIMTMIEQINRKRSKKGFTLVELVIVIAILAILAAIAIPVINTVIISAKMSVLESDCVTLQMLMDEAIMTYRYGNRSVTYNGKPVGEATYKDVILEAGLDYNDFDTFDKPRKIGKMKYYIYWMGGEIVYSTHCNWWELPGAVGTLPVRSILGYHEDKVTIARMVQGLEQQEKKGIQWNGIMP